MAAKDYHIVEGCLGTIYLAKKLKTEGKISQDRRVIEDNEIIGMFIHYLKRFCEENDGNTLVITDPETNAKIFEATLFEK